MLLMVLTSVDNWGRFTSKRERDGTGFKSCPYSFQEQEDQRKELEENQENQETQENQDSDETGVDDDEVIVIPYSQTMWSVLPLNTWMNSLLE